MPELSPRRRLAVLAICCLSLLIVSLDNTILNVALPSLQRDFHSSLSGLQWTIDAYLIVLASLLLLSVAPAPEAGDQVVEEEGAKVYLE
ncbi:MFS transporter, partial [Actinomadura sp. NPDC048032]